MRLGLLQKIFASGFSVVLAVRVDLEQMGYSHFMRFFDGSTNGIAFSAIALVYDYGNIFVRARRALNQFFVGLVVSVVNHDYRKVVSLQRRDNSSKRVAMIINWNHKALAHFSSFSESEGSARKSFAFVGSGQFIGV